MGLADQLEEAQAKVDALRRQIGRAKCAEIGRHTMVSMGGCNCGCLFDDGELLGQCSVPVNQCSVCGWCDYGENQDAVEIRQACHERWVD